MSRADGSLHKSCLPGESPTRYCCVWMGNQLDTSDGTLEGRKHFFPVRIYYEDTDLSGLVYHANYLKYCERARSSLLRVLGIDQRAAHEAGEGNYAVADANMRFLLPAKLDDSLTVQTECVELKGASVRLAQRVFRGDELLVELTLRVGFIAPNGRPRRQPDAWRAAFSDLVVKESE